MSFLKGIIDSLGSIFSDSTSPDETQSSPKSSPNFSDNRTMDGVVGTGVSNQRIAYKLKGFYDLATEEIAKAVRAEEWGLVDDAIVHYKNAQRILIEASSTSTPSFISSSEQEKVKSYRQKISKWQGQVAERLEILIRRAGGTSTNKVWTNLNKVTP